MKIRLIIQIVAGLLILGLGISVIVGWITRNPIPLQLHSGFIAMVVKSLHTLSGTLGMLGATDFSNAAQFLEQQLLENQSSEPSPVLWNEVQTELEATLNAARQWLRLFEGN